MNISLVVPERVLDFWRKSQHEKFKKFYKYTRVHVCIGCFSPYFLGFYLNRFFHYF